MSKVTVTPLGTVSPYCKGSKNCPAFLVTYNDTKILLDCGNGSTRLLNMPNDLENLNVFITHFHSDHFGDLPLIQYASYVYNNLGILNNKVNIFLPISEHLDSKSFIFNNDKSFAQYFDIHEDLVYTIGEIKVSFHNNNSHTIETFAIKIETDWFKLVYTSDVGNTNIDGLVAFCQDANILICESSFVKSHNANSSTHLHAYEAALIAKKACVKKLILTHFWPETDINEYLNEALVIFNNTEAAIENKTLSLRNSKKL